MTRFLALGFLTFGVGCHEPAAAEPAVSAVTTEVQPWETVDATFNGCAGG